MEYCLLNPKYWTTRYVVIDIAYRKYTFPEFTLNYIYKSYLAVNPHSFQTAKILPLNYFLDNLCDVFNLYIFNNIQG